MEENGILNREITALTEAMFSYHITESCIITYNTERIIAKEGLSI